MEKDQFKNLFDTIAKNNGYSAAYGGWFKESEDCIFVLELQKSNFSNSYYLNIKTYIKGSFGRVYSINKDIIKKEMGNIFTRQPKEYDEVFDLDSPIVADLRKHRLEDLFREYIIPYANQMLSKAGIVEYAKNGGFLLPAIKKELGI